MKFVEKKCPNCHANLEFEPGAHSVKCKNCRRDFAIEYDADYIDPGVQLKAKDIQLKLLDDFEQARSFSKVMFAIVFAFISLVVIVTVVLAIQGYESYRENKAHIEQNRLNQEKNYQQQRESMEQQREQEDDLYQKMRDEIDRRAEEQEKEREEMMRKFQERNGS